MTRLFASLFIALSALLLQGCFPLAATGLASGALMIDDRRTSGVYIEDENIEWKANARIRDKFKDVYINTISYNLNVLVTGQVPNEDVKKQVEETVRAIPSVKNVTNEIVVAGNASLASRGSDALVTSNVKARFIGNGKVSPNHVKVFTESGVVYLLGIVTQAEGEAAADIARNTSGVSRVVKVFEYIPNAPKK
jgi:osmotically-inducible protein OsmY